MDSFDQIRFKMQGRLQENHGAKKDCIVPVTPLVVKQCSEQPTLLCLCERSGGAPGGPGLRGGLSLSQDCEMRGAALHSIDVLPLPYGTLV